ncbi:acyltransferase [Nocardia amamiensis]|uniref:Acyltransferase n=1 Tax=Nocardia amamiensis TaxID=404578 RepID=A0ABS0CSF1_9NOCA|nr:acyltransferase [Nocardia amamiensis]MBF6299529.1 acyltransferase [Nocardia amamiensis]
MTAPRSRTTPRDWNVDVVRAFAIGVVVVVHWISVRVTGAGGAVRGDLSLHGRPIWTSSWVLQVMPLFFLAGGFANTLVIDRWRAQGTSYGAYLGPRARRLTLPMIPLIAVLAPVVWLLRAHSDAMAQTAAHVVASPLWFLAVYLIAVTIAPLAVQVHDRSAWCVPAGLLAASLTVDALRFTGSGYAEWNLLFVWLFCHQLGVLHARRTLRPVPNAGLLAIIAIGIGALVAMVLAGPYPPTMYGVADAAVSNLAPPTTAISILAVIQLAIFTLADRRTRTWEPHGSTRRVIDYVSARLMTIYLWHIPVISAVTGAALSAPALLLPRDPQTWWLTRPLWILGCGIALLGVVRLMTYWDLFCAGYAARTTSTAALTGAVVAAASVYVIWRHGLSPEGTTGLAIVGVVVATALLSTTRTLASRSGLLHRSASA